MSSEQTIHNTRLLEFLRRVAPFSVVDHGLTLANSGFVAEAVRVGDIIQGSVISDQGEHYGITLKVLSNREIDASCSCSSKEDMQEQWCAHAVALLWNAHDLGFFEPFAGFSNNESVYHPTPRKPQEIADALQTAAKIDAWHSEYQYIPDVSILLQVNRDRLGMKVLFDQTPQAPTIFNGFTPPSSRALDNLLLELLDDKGSWDDDNQIWWISSATSVETALGLLQEYDKIFIGDLNTPVKIYNDLIAAKIYARWTDAGLELQLGWVLPDNRIIFDNGQLIGTGPYWKLLDAAIYRVQPGITHLASFFSSDSTLSLSRAQAGPFLELIQQDIDLNRLLTVENQHLQPISEVKSPTPILEFDFYQEGTDHYSVGSSFVIEGLLDFEYPKPPIADNVVYLPDRDLERRLTEVLRELGFRYDPEKRRYLLFNDDALELVFEKTGVFKRPWRINGLEQIRKSLRRSQLTINVSLFALEEEVTSSSANGVCYDCQITLVQNNAKIPLSNLFRNANSLNNSWIRLDSGAYAKVPGGGVNLLGVTLGAIEPNYRICNTIKTKISALQAISLMRLEDDNFKIITDRRLKNLAKRLKEFSSIKALKATRNFKGKLRPYQEEGISWLNFLREFDLGGILADEMGLGKTVQTLAFLQYIKDKQKTLKSKYRANLVVAPTSVITNWYHEAQRFTPNLKVLLLHGPDRKKRFEAIAEHDLVITSYALLRIDRSDLEPLDFNYLILDEAQNIKNPQAATTKAAKAIKAQHRLALTGTPTENRPLELWSIIDFLMPGHIGSHEFFKNQIEKPIIEGGTTTAAIDYLKSKTKPFVLRREKHEVEKDLPPKIQAEMFVGMTNAQRSLYNQILSEVRPQIFDAVNKKGIRGASISILAALLRLRQVCNHPNSLGTYKNKQDMGSGKLEALQELISEAIDSGHKILVFSQFLEMLNIIRRWLQQEGVNYLYLDGATKNRAEIIDQFNNDDEVSLFLISLKAGGTGLNLTAADTVIIYDPWWNPAVENQAVDRAHRIGQTKTVNVYRLITENSIEEKIMKLKEKKAALIKALINDNGLSTINLTRGDLENLFSQSPTY